MKFRKKILGLWLGMLILFSCVFFAQGKSVGSVTPASSSAAELLWAAQYGTSYRDAPSIPILAGDYLAIMSGRRLLKVSCEDGSIVSEASLSETPGYACVAPTYDGGILYCQLDNATVEAYDFSSMTRLWSYTDALGGQSLSPVTVEDGRVYTGFWNNDDEPASYVCLDAATGELLWRLEQPGGFYWAGSVVVGDCLVFGRDDGTVFDDGASEVLCVDKNTGKILDRLPVIGDVRSSVSRNDADGRLYFVTKGEYLYSVALTADGAFEHVMTLSLGGASTSTPVFFRNRVYVGVQTGMMKGNISVIDAATLSLLYTAETPGYPQNEFLLSTAYGDTVYLYTTYNALPGGLLVLKDSAGQTQAQVETLFTPDSTQANFCISSIQADENGTLYYKNDSGTVFAVRNTADFGRFAAILQKLQERILTIFAFFHKIFV